MAGEAKFTVNTTASADGAGDRIFLGTNSQVITLALEVALSNIVSTKYQLVDPNNEFSPQASHLAPVLNFDTSGTPTEIPASPFGDSTFTLPATGMHSYVARATVTIDDGSTDVFERMISIPTACGSRKIVPAEKQQANFRGWSDAQNKQIDCESAGGSGNWEIFLQNDVVTTEDSSVEMFSVSNPVGNVSMTGRVELVAHETSEDSDSSPYIARLAFDFAFYDSGTHSGSGPNRAVLRTGIPAAIVVEQNGTFFATGTLSLLFTAPGDLKVTAVHAVGFSRDVKWCATFYAVACDGPIPDVP